MKISATSVCLLDVYRELIPIEEITESYRNKFNDHEYKKSKLFIFIMKSPGYKSERNLFSLFLFSFSLGLFRSRAWEQSQNINSNYTVFKAAERSCFSDNHESIMT